MTTIEIIIKGIFGFFASIWGLSILLYALVYEMCKDEYSTRDMFKETTFYKVINFIWQFSSIILLINVVFSLFYYFFIKPLTS